MLRSYFKNPLEECSVDISNLNESLEKQFNYWFELKK